METPRKNENRTLAQGVAANYVLPSRNLRKSDLGGVIFGCKHNTIKECLTKQLFGLPSIHYSYIRNIEQGLPLFLFNYSDRHLHGIFEAAGPGQMNVDPYAWSEDGQIRTPFPAQVRMYTRTSCIPVPESQFKKIIKDNYYKDFHFCFELDHNQTKHLISLFKPCTSYVPPQIRPIKIVPSKTTSTVSYKKTLLKDQTENYDTKEWVNEKENKNDWTNNEWSRGNNWADQVEWESENNNNGNNDWASNENYNGNYNESDSNQFKTPPNEINWTSNQVKWGDEEDNNNNNNNDAEIGFGKDNEWSDGVYEQDTKDNMWCSYDPNVKDKNVYQETKHDEWGVYDPNVDTNNVYEAALTKLRAIVLEKEELKGCVSEKEMKFPEEPFDIDYLNLPKKNIELIQIIKQFKLKTIEMEKKQVESEKEIERLNAMVIKSSKNVFILENRVAELESNIVSTKSIQYAQSDKTIYFIGGYDGVKWLSSLDSFSPSEDSVKSLMPMSCSRSYASVSALGDGIFVCGGGDGSSWFDTVECYKRNTDEWVQCPSLSSAKGSLAGLTLNGKIYAIGGGNDQTCLSEVEMFDPILGKWIKTQSMLEKRFAPAAVEFNGSIYTVGGYDGKVYLQTAERYDPREGYWMRIPSMNTRRGCSSLAVLGVLLYCVGGYDGEKMVSSMETFDPRLTTWVPGRPMRNPRGYAASAILDDNFYVFGGLSMGDKILDNVECFNQRTGWYEPGFKSVGKRCFTSAITL